MERVKPAAVDECAWAKEPAECARQRRMDQQQAAASSGNKGRVVEGLLGSEQRTDAEIEELMQAKAAAGSGQQAGPR